MAVVVKVGEAQAVDVYVSATDNSVGFDIGQTVYLDRPPYYGATEITPTQETQTLGTKGRWVAGDITVNPIPSNYGLITWDGSVLIVS